MCKEKQEWLDSTEDATTEDFIAQRIAFNDVVGPVVQKLMEPGDFFLSEYLVCIRLH